MGSPHDTTLRKPLTPLEALSEYGCLTDAQIAGLTRMTPATVRKQLSALANASKVHRVGQRRGKSGRPIAVSCLPGSHWESSPTREHQLQLNEVRIAFKQGSDAIHGLRCKTWDTQRVALETEPSQKLSGGYVRPDAIAHLSHEQADQPLVVFIELDRGTEALSRKSARQTSWQNKALLYQQTETLTRWRDWALESASIQQDAICRLAIVTTTMSRLARIDDVLQQVTPSVSPWLTQYAEVIAHGLWAAIWQQSGKQTKRRFLGCD